MHDGGPHDGGATDASDAQVVQRYELKGGGCSTTGRSSSAGIWMFLLLTVPIARRLTRRKRGSSATSAP